MTKASEKATSVAVKENPGIVALADDADLMADLASSAGEGAYYSPEEMIIPFVRLAQALSPQLNARKPEYIKNLALGDAYNNLTNDIWGAQDGLDVVVVFQDHKLLEFVPRANGGGFRGVIDPSDPVMREVVRDGSTDRLPNGNDLVHVDHHYVLIVGEDGYFEPAVIDMKSTQLKISRKWKTLINLRKMRHPGTGVMFTPPLWGTVWHLRSTEETNEKGDFFNWSVSQSDMQITRTLLDEAKRLRETVLAGSAVAGADYSDVQGPTTASAGGSVGGSAGSPHGDDIPF